jgi:hypothetical protein
MHMPSKQPAVDIDGDLAELNEYRDVRDRAELAKLRKAKADQAEQQQNEDDSDTAIAAYHHAETKWSAAIGNARDAFGARIDSVLQDFFDAVAAAGNELATVKKAALDARRKAYPTNQSLYITNNDQHPEPALVTVNRVVDAAQESLGHRVAWNSR